MKKKVLSMFLICSIILNICNLSVFAFSNSEQKRISELINNSIVLSTQTPVCYVWGEQTYVDKENLSVMPLIKNDRTLVPVRFVAESLGAVVNWDSNTQTATIISNSDEIKITINLDYMYVNNEKINLDVPAQIIQDRTLIPLRAISEALDKNIFYHKGFILVSDYDINLDSNDSDIQRIVEYLRYTMLVYDKDDGSQISFMNKSVGENSFCAVYAEQIPFETEKNKLVSVTGGMYIENLKCVDAGNENYTISMDVYNTSYTYGAVEFYDADGSWLGSNKIDKYESIGTSLENTITNAWEGTFGIGWAIGNGIMGDWSDLQYRNGTISKHSYIQKTVPKGSFLYITNNIKESPYVAMYDMVSIAVDSVSLASDWIDVFKGSDKKKFLDAAKENIMEELSDEAFETVITNTEFANIIASDYSLGSISDYINNVVEKTVTILEDNNIDIAKSLQDTALKMGKDITVGTAESLLKKAMSFIGTALNVCFNIGKTCDFASFIADIRKATSTDPLLLIVGFEEQKISYDEAVVIWNEFLIGGNYVNYTKEVDVTSLEYVIADLNDDNMPELLIQSTVDTPFYNTWIFALNNTDVIFVDDFYGYGQFRYSPKLNLVIGVPDFRPFLGTGYSPFYKLNGNQLENIFTIGQDEGASFYSDNSGTKNISDNERSQYYNEAIFFEWNRIQSLKPIDKSYKIDLSQYINTDIYDFINMIGDMYDVGATDGSTEFSNGTIIVSADYGSNAIKFISINGYCDYSIKGIEYGMSFTDATGIAYENCSYVSRDLPYYKYFKMNDGTELSFHAEDEKIDSINLFAN